jgi:hypothetical protein
MAARVSRREVWERAWEWGRKKEIAYHLPPSLPVRPWARRGPSCPVPGDEGRAATVVLSTGPLRANERGNDGFTPGGHAKQREQPPRVTVRFCDHIQPRTLSRWPSGPAKSRPTNQWLGGYVTKGDGGLNEPTVRTTWAVPKSDRTARIARSGKRTAHARPRHQNGRPGFLLRGWTRIYPRMLLLDVEIFHLYTVGLALFYIPRELWYIKSLSYTTLYTYHISRIL